MKTTITSNHLYCPQTTIVGLTLVGVLICTSCGGTVGLNGTSQASNRVSSTSNTQSDNQPAPKQDKPTSTPVPVPDNSASSPQVVTGTYLTCVVSSLDSVILPMGQRAVGCNVVGSNGQPVSLAQTPVFSATTPAGPVAPSSQPSLGGYQSWFALPTPVVAQTQFHVIVRNETSSGQINSQVQNPPATLTFNETSLGLWNPGGPTDIINAFMTDPQCPASPDNFCDSQGNLTKGSPVSDDSVRKCIGSNKLSSIITGLAWLNNNPPAPVSTITLSGTFCTNPKNISGVSHYLIRGSACSVAIVSDQNYAKTLVFRNAPNIGEPANAASLEQQLQASSCANPH